MTPSGTVTGRLVHEALFYRGLGEFLTLAATFVTTALAAGEPVMVAVPRQRLELLRRRLGPAAEPVKFVDMTETGRNPGRIIPFLLQAFTSEHRGRPARMLGEPIWPERTAEEYDACVQHEALVNLALGDTTTTVLCPYDVESLPPAVLADARRTHPYVSERGTRRPSAPYHPAVGIRLDEPLAPPTGPVSELRFAGGGLGGLRRFAAVEAARAGLAPDRVDDLLLAVNELAANTIRYSGGPGVLRIWCTDRDLICEVTDGGRLTDPLVGRLAPSPDSPGGRGLLIVNHLCDLVRIHAAAHSTTVRAYFRR
jgi:anti-sigma regulatory factor (Ser/Thr protein kinase)